MIIGKSWSWSHHGSGGSDMTRYQTRGRSVSSAVRDDFQNEQNSNLLFSIS